MAWPVWGGEGAAEILTHLIEVSICTCGVDDLFSELRFSPLEFVL